MFGRILKENIWHLRSCKIAANWITLLANFVTTLKGRHFAMDLVQTLQTFKLSFISGLKIVRAVVRSFIFMNLVRVVVRSFFFMNFVKVLFKVVLVNAKAFVVLKIFYNIVSMRKSLFVNKITNIVRQDLVLIFFELSKNVNRFV